MKPATKLYLMLGVGSWHWKPCYIWNAVTYGKGEQQTCTARVELLERDPDDYALMVRTTKLALHELCWLYTKSRQAANGIEDCKFTISSEARVKHMLRQCCAAYV
ncbi:hypothetical protein M378DRAFT_850097 [Amanita muscaria Koide BX008]|uniref:Uncharacterized protein n=1 Tax=Amanita muscaria (strain Koide BX008) TaxID=946122 RepID=A0A0C2WJ83_AMAMK|nr:hypothetical protein M378DRAFT_850097 [Amanita muscaria Koide BX008]